MVVMPRARERTIALSGFFCLYDRCSASMKRAILLVALVRCILFVCIL